MNLDVDGWRRDESDAGPGLSFIPFNRPSFDGNELDYVARAMQNGHTSGNGPFTLGAESMLEALHPGSKVLLTTSGTHALELAARLVDLGPGDEVIVPAFTFVSTASAFMWNGARPVFADVRSDTLNIDPESVERLVNDRTKAICIVHYGGVGAEPDRFADLARRRGLALIEDNAHGLGARYRGATLGTFGAMSALSFHETKNITCGEGGALVVNDPALVERAEVLREKGTNRSRFLRGLVDKYTWVDVGSSWVLSDLLAAVLVGQLERFEAIQYARTRRWDTYARELAEWAATRDVRLPDVPSGAEHSGHLFHLRLVDRSTRDRFISHLKGHGVLSVFHYQSLADSPVGRSLGNGRPCPVSAHAADVLVRLPLFNSLSEVEQRRVIDAVRAF
jgi:dTDP-4-amino-4,6-dideoxygalactose transaminase